MLAANDGAIWLQFNFTNPINDILERDSFELREILDQDDLLQEIKIQNHALLDFLVEEQTIEKLIHYISYPEDSCDSWEISHRYAYLSCEVICCEIPEMIGIFFQGKNKLIRQFFQILDVEGKINPLAAGFFEKVFNVFLRTRFVSLIDYLNNEGFDLFRKFLNHIGNYSIAMTFQKLFEISAETFLGGIRSKTNATYTIAFEKRALVLLLNKLNDDGSDVNFNVAELLFTIIIQNATEKQFIEQFFEPDIIRHLVTLALPEPPELNDDSSFFEQKLSINLPTDHSRMLSSLKVLNTLLKCCTTFPELLECDENRDLILSFQITIVLVCGCLRTYESDSPTLLTQTNQSVSRIGSYRLEMIKFLERIVCIPTNTFDDLLIQQDALKICLDLFFKFELNNILQQSVCNIFVYLIEFGALSSQKDLEESLKIDFPEGSLEHFSHSKFKKCDFWDQNNPKYNRENIQRHIIVDCMLILRILQVFQNVDNSMQPSLLAQYNAFVILIAQALVEASSIEDDQTNNLNYISRLIANETEIIDPWGNFIHGPLAFITIIQNGFLGGVEPPSRHDENMHKLGEHDLNDAAGILTDDIGNLDLEEFSDHHEPNSTIFSFSEYEDPFVSSQNHIYNEEHDDIFNDFSGEQANHFDHGENENNEIATDLDFYRQQNFQRFFLDNPGETQHEDTNETPSNTITTNPPTLNPETQATTSLFGLNNQTDQFSFVQFADDFENDFANFNSFVGGPSLKSPEYDNNTTHHDDFMTSFDPNLKISENNKSNGFEAFADFDVFAEFDQHQTEH